MCKRVLKIAGIVGLVICYLVTPALAAETDAVPFADAQARFEQNATDGDVEAVFEIIGRSDGLTKLKVVAPNGRTVIDFTATAGANASQKSGTVGIRQFTFESPEPRDVAGLKASYPAGEYIFTGETAKGAKLESKAALDHTLPATTKFVFPKRGAQEVPTKNVVIKWEPVKGVSGYKVELEHSDSGASIQAKLPESATSFAVPEGFLVPGGEYQLGIGTVATSGNVSVIEMDFTTAGGK
jgi:hypothetical protein